MDRPTNADRIELGRWFAAHGWGVLPLWSPGEHGCHCPAGDACGIAGKHPMTRHGVKDAATDPERIPALLDKPTEPNIGLTPPPGVVILDVDGPDTERLAALASRLGALPDTMTFRTAHGYHVVLALDPERDPGGNLFRFVTRRHMTGYVVGPRSWHAAGVAYGWDGIEHIAPLPEAWVAAARHRMA